MKDHIMFMAVARTIAEMSYCKRLKVGCVIVKDGRMLSNGYNGTMPGYVNNCEDVINGKLVTHTGVIHAEANALYKLAKNDGGGTGATLYCTTIPCKECAKGIILSGITTIIFQDWYRTKEFEGNKESLEYFKSFQIKVYQFNGNRIDER